MREPTTTTSSRESEGLASVAALLDPVAGGVWASRLPVPINVVRNTAKTAPVARRPAKSHVIELLPQLPGEAARNAKLPIIKALTGLDLQYMAI